MAKKVEIIKSLLVACRDEEPLFIIRSLQGKLRIGLAEKSVLTALAHAIVYTPPSIKSPPPVLDASKGVNAQKFIDILLDAKNTVWSVYSEVPSYDRIIPVLLEEGGLASLPEKCFLTPGVPVHPMLAHPTTGVEEVLKRLSGSGLLTCEFKYDGERAQIHYFDDGKMQIYSRNLENHTPKYPDIIDRLPKAINKGVKSFILDCEAVAFDPKTNKILTFQVLSTRGRKDVKLEDIKVPVCLFAFDLLFLNGKPLTKLPLQERRKLLRESFHEVENQFTWAIHKDTTDPEDIQAFLNEAVERNCEGLMIKTMEKDATYEAGKRSLNWLKLKKDYLAGGGDSLDLVVIGAYKGKGKRTGVYGGFLLACYDDESETYQSACKLGTGFSEEDLKKLSEELQAFVIDKPRSYYSFGDSVEADVWFDPKLVWEVLTADLSLSPVHKAGIGLVEDNKGIALRFPRFVRIRDDKKPEQATNSQQVADMFRAQKINHPAAGPPGARGRAKTTADDDD